jgi:hypothetical protein
LLGLLAAGLWAAVDIVRLALGSGHTTYQWGDQALLDLGARRAWHLDQLVGPYSRFGWHHPGPALFYLFAIPVRMFEPQGPGLDVGTVLINGAASVAVVALVWRRAGPRAGLGAGVAVAALALSLTAAVMQTPWNPYLIILPLVLFCVLWADAVQGRPGALAWAAVVGSYVAQTHISAAPFCVAMIALAVAVFAVVRRRRPVVRGTERRAAVAGLVVFVAAWIPPVVELWRDDPNNFTLLWRYFTSHQPGDPSLATALHQSLDAMTILPFSFNRLSPVIARSTIDLALGCAALAAVTVAAWVIGWRRRQALALALVASGVLGGAIGVVVTTRVSGGLFVYLIIWQAFVPCVLLIGLAIALLAPPVGMTSLDGTGALGARHRQGRRARPVEAGVALVVCVLAGLILTPLAVRDNLRVSPPWQANVAVGQLSAAGERVLGPRDHLVNVTIGTASAWPTAAGLVDELERLGHPTTVSPVIWVSVFGHARLPDRAVAVDFDIYQVGDSAAAASFDGKALATSGGFTLAYRRAPA